MNIRCRVVARLLLPFFLVWSLAVPRPAYAVLPLIAPVALSFLNAAGAVVTTDAAAAAASALIGGVAIALILSTPGDTLNVNGQVRLPLTASTPPAALPAPVAAATVTATASVAWSFTCSGASGVAVSLQAAGEAYVSAMNASSACNGGGAYVYRVDPSSTATVIRISYSLYGGPWSSPYVPSPGPFVETLTCSSGYALSGSTCNLSNPRAAAPDKKQDFQRGGNAFQAYDGDDKPAGFDGHISTTSTVGDTVTVSGVDSAGNPVRFSIQALSSGGSLVSQSVQRVDANGSTYTHHRIVSVDTGGTVTSDSANDTAQTFAYNSATNQYDLSGSAAPVAPPASTNINLPTDYARSGEAAAAAQTIINDRAADAATVPVAVQNPALAGAMANRDLLPSEIAAVVDSSPVIAPSLFQPFDPAECQPLSFTFGSAQTGGISYTANLDICPHVSTIRNIFSWVLYLITAALLFQMFTRRPESGG
ncbi:MAG: hypothetical protein HZC43_02250 [Nitrosomonadales bacterium]|nr:hypothetical protein [Nitrosomonadales bacterium]